MIHSALEEMASVDVLMLYERTGEPPKIIRASPLLVEGSWPSGFLRTGRRTGRRQMNRALADKIDFRQYDLICGRHLWPIGGLDLPRDRPTIVDLDDLHFTFSSHAPLPRRVFQSTKFAVDYMLESAAMRRYTACWFTSVKDQKRHPTFPSRILPNVPFRPRITSAEQSTGLTILFVGSLWYQPNQQAVGWFLRTCWPRILQAEPRARFKIVGLAGERDRRRWASMPGVEAPGFVPDLAGTYADAAFTVAPIFSGSGSNIKVLESLAHRRACVTTSFASQAFVPHLRGGVHLAALEGEDEWVDTCLALLKDRGKRAALADAGKEVVDRVFSPETFRRAVQELVVEVTSSAGSSSRT